MYYLPINFCINHLEMFSQAHSSSEVVDEHGNAVNAFVPGSTSEAKQKKSNGQTTLVCWSIWKQRNVRVVASRNRWFFQVELLLIMYCWSKEFWLHNPAMTCPKRYNTTSSPPLYVSTLIYRSSAKIWSIKLSAGTSHLEQQPAWIPRSSSGRQASAVGAGHWTAPSPECRRRCCPHP